MKRICIFLEQYLIPIKYTDNLKNFILCLSKNYYVTIYSPDIDVIIQKPNCNNIKNLYLDSFRTITSSNFDSNFDLLIIFSNYNRNIFFDRRPLIIKSFKCSKVILMPTNNFLQYIPLDKNIFYITDEFSDYILNYKTFCCKSIFENVIVFKDDIINNFYEKYILETDKKIIAFLPGNNSNYDGYFNKSYNLINKLGNIFINNLDSLQNKLNEKGYCILGLKNDDSNMNFSSNKIKWIKSVDYNILKYLAKCIITISNIDVIRYCNLNKVVINIGPIPLSENLKINKQENNRYIHNVCLKKIKNINRIYEEIKIINLDKVIIENINNSSELRKNVDNCKENVDLINLINDIISSKSRYFTNYNK